MRYILQKKLCIRFQDLRPTKNEAEEEIESKIKAKTPKKKLSKQEKQDLKDQILKQMAMVRGQVKKARWKKDIKSGTSQLKRLERQLKKIR